MNELVIMKAHGLIISILDGIDNDLLPDELKTRPKGQSDRIRKMLFEKKLARVISQRFKKQKEKIAQWLSMRHPERSKVIVKEPPPLPDDLFDDDDTFAELQRLFIAAYMHSVNQMDVSSLFNIDYSIFNEQALAWAHKNTLELIDGIDDTTRKTIIAAIEAFIETPGMTIGDVVNALPFDTGRAFMIARTEITRTYSQAEIAAGLAAKKQFPDVRVTKTWLAALNERTCSICGALHTVEVDIDEQFDGGYDGPPAHPNCACSLSVRTRI